MAAGESGRGSSYKGPCRLLPMACTLVLYSQVSERPPGRPLVERPRLLAFSLFCKSRFLSCQMRPDDRRQTPHLRISAAPRARPASIHTHIHTSTHLPPSPIGMGYVPDLGYRHSASLFPPSPFLVGPRLSPSWGFRPAAPLSPLAPAMLPRPASPYGVPLVPFSTLGGPIPLSPGVLRVPMPVLMPRITPWEMAMLIRLWNGVPRAVWMNPAILLSHLVPHFGQARAQQLVSAGASTLASLSPRPSDVVHQMSRADLQVMPDSDGTYTHVQGGARVQGQITSEPHSPSTQNQAGGTRPRADSSASDDRPHAASQTRLAAVTPGELESESDEYEQSSQHRRSSHDLTPHHVPLRLRARSRGSSQALSGDDQHILPSYGGHRSPDHSSDP